jgi:hypothetical protein
MGNASYEDDRRDRRHHGKKHRHGKKHWHRR